MRKQKIYPTASSFHTVNVKKSTEEVTSVPKFREKVTLKKGKISFDGVGINSIKRKSVPKKAKSLFYEKIWNAFYGKRFIKRNTLIRFLSCLCLPLVV